MGAQLRFFFDYVDPLSYRVQRLLIRRGLDGISHLTYHPYELNPPPAPLLDPGGPNWHGRWEAATAAGGDQEPLKGPILIPWSRKAHELAAFAHEKGCFLPVHRSLFEAFFERGVDIGRVDLLVDLAAAAGLDRSEAKAVLDVDRYVDGVIRQRAEAESDGVFDVPVLDSPAGRSRGVPEEATWIEILGTAGERP